MAGHRVQTQVDLACHIIYVFTVLASLNTHTRIAISWPFAHSPVCTRGSMGSNQQQKEGVYVCVFVVCVCVVWRLNN